jgi:hypothetical protein
MSVEEWEKRTAQRFEPSQSLDLTGAAFCRSAALRRCSGPCHLEEVTPT